MVEQCVKALNRLGETNLVILQWINVGHAGNEAADQYAKLGSEGVTSGPEPFLPVPQSYTDANIKQSQTNSKSS